MTLHVCEHCDTQVYRVAKALAKAGAPLRCAAMTGGQSDEAARSRSLRTQRQQLAEGVDLLIATPGRLQEQLKAGHLSLEGCKALVLDEVDVLLGECVRDWLCECGGEGCKD